MITIVVSFTIDSPAATVWELVGDPGKIASWHPAIAASSCEGDTRTCVLPDGGEVVERMHRVDHAARTHEYSIVAAPFPMKDHAARFEVKESGPNRSVVQWSCTYDAAGAPEEQAASGMRDVYVLGLETLRARLARSSG